MGKPTITVIDETIREGMQYQGLMFSDEQRAVILDFQQALGVDVCQAGYPAAHELEARAVAALAGRAYQKDYSIRICALGRAMAQDADRMLATGARELHLHVHVRSAHQLAPALARVAPVFDRVRKNAPGTQLGLVMLDMGKSTPQALGTALAFCESSAIPFLSLPDTSGIMAPNQVHDTLAALDLGQKQTRVGIHCHNDMGMASANSIMGIAAGARVLEASVLGIGERNGIADLFTTARLLADQGFTLNLNLDDLDTFTDYYAYVDRIILEQLGRNRLTPDVPFFGSAVRTHVAGTHANAGFGVAGEGGFFLNSLCGKGLVEKFCRCHDIDCPPGLLAPLTRAVKEQSIRLNRSLNPDQVKKIIVQLTESGQT